MHPNKNNETEDDIRPEYDFSGGVRGKQYQVYRQGTNLVPLDPDVANMFPDAIAVRRTAILNHSKLIAKAQTSLALTGSIFMNHFLNSGNLDKACS